MNSVEEHFDVGDEFIPECVRSEYQNAIDHYLKIIGPVVVGSREWLAVTRSARMIISNSSKFPTLPQIA
jgi:hypothetical protein